MTHDSDCPAAYPCCPNDEYGCPIHAEPPCNCDATEAPDFVVTLSVCLCCPDGIHAARPVEVTPSSRKVGGGHDE